MKKTGVDYALELAAQGFNIVPAPAGEKLPKIRWREFQDKRVTERQLRTWFSGGRRNYFLITGAISGICVLDCDTEAAEQWWSEKLGPEMDRTGRVRTRKGHHYYFRLPPGVGVGGGSEGGIRGRSHHDKETGIEWDFRCEGGGVVVPPSVYETGFAYEWVEGRGPEAIVEAPEALLRAVVGREEGQGAKGRSMLVRLLGDAPVGAESGRNDWLARVGGHLVAGVRFEDGLLAALRWFNSGLTDPLPDEEVAKMAPSLLAAEARASRDDALTVDNGWLKSGGTELLVQVANKVGDETRMDLAPFLNCDLRAKGVAASGGVATYDVEVVKEGESIAALLPAEVLAEDRALAKWLAGYRAGIVAPANAYPKAPSHERVRRYLESQDPTEFEIVPYLGWCPDGFLCHEGVITESGLKPSLRYRLDPRVGVDRSNFRYGFRGSMGEAREVLREALTFHDETVTAVFGAWWAATFLKPQIHRVASLFPFMAMQAPSESGKTTGFFSVMLQLAGSVEGQLATTAASFRDYVGAHQSGIVWADDKDDPRVLHEILRAATGEGSMVKKGEDRTSQVLVKLVAPIVISGETLGLGSQKALLDRAVPLVVPSPTGRRSVRADGKGSEDRLQWLDILDFRERYPDLTDFSGWYVQALLGMSGKVAGLPALAPRTGGRFGDKVAVVRLGGQLLSGLLEDPSWSQRVDTWAADQVGLGSENSLTLEILPTALRQTNWCARPRSAEGRWPATPAVVRDGEVWFSPPQLAQWWREYRNGRIEPRVESEEAIIEQARSLGLGGTVGTDRKQLKHSGDGSTRTMYWRVDRPLSELLLARSRGEEPHAGVHPQQHAEEFFPANEPPRRIS